MIAFEFKQPVKFLSRSGQTCMLLQNKFLPAEQARWIARSPSLRPRRQVGEDKGGRGATCTAAFQRVSSALKSVGYSASGGSSRSISAPRAADSTIAVVQRHVEIRHCDAGGIDEVRDLGAACSRSCAALQRYGGTEKGCRALQCVFPATVTATVTPHLHLTPTFSFFPFFSRWTCDTRRCR
jgi:hypothetical protein